MQEILFDLGRYPNEDGLITDIIVDKKELLGRHHENLLSFIDVNTILFKVLINDHISLSEKSKGYDLMTNTEVLYDFMRDLHPYFEKNDGLISHYLNRVVAGRICEKTSDKARRIKRIKHCLFTRGLKNADVAWYLEHAINPKNDPESLTGIQERLKAWILIVKDMQTPVLSDYHHIIRENLFAALMAGDAECGCVELSDVRVRSGVRGTDALAEIASSVDSDSTLARNVYGSLAAIIKGKKPLPDLNDFLRSFPLDDIEGECIIYDINEFADLFDAEMHILSNEGRMFSHCKECGKLFLYNENEKYPEYCYGKNASGDRCKDIAKKKETVKKAQELYRHYYKVHHQRKKRGKMTEEELKAWMKRFTEMKEGVLSGKVELEAYRNEIKK